MRICDVIHNLRENHHMTQAAVAKGMGISQGTVSAIELGVRKPSYEMLYKFAEFFNTPVSELLKDADDAPDESDSDIAAFIHRSPKQKLLFSKTKYLTDSDMDAIISVVSAIARERVEE